MIEKSVFVDLSDYFSRIDIYGEDSLDLLDRLSTNKLDDLTDPFMGMHSVLTTNKGRIIDLLSVNRLPDKVLLMTAGESKNKVIDWIEFYTIMEDVTLKDVSTETCHFRLIGDSWEDLFPTMTDLPIHNSFIWEFEGESFIAIKEEMSSFPCVDVIGTAGVKNKLTQVFSTKSNSLTLEEFTQLRLELGIPAFGYELTEDFNPLEAGLISHINFNKGCYIGQEVVARLNTYDKVQRKLVRLSWEGIPAEKDITYDGHLVGVITSAMNGAGLGFVRNSHAELSKELECGNQKVMVTEILAE